MRRTLIIGAIGVVVIGLGMAVYFIFFAGSAGVTVAPSGSASLPVAGQGTSPTGEEQTSASSSPINMPVAVSARLVKISDGPVVPGEVVVNRTGSASTSQETAVNFIERRSGNVYEYLARAGTLTRTSNKTVPGIQSAVWLPNGSTAFVRYLSGDNFSTINTYALNSNGTNGFFLSQNLADITVSSTSVLTLVSGVNGSSASLLRTDGTRPSEIFTTPLSSLRIGFAGRNQYLAFTKPSAALPGSAFIVDNAGRFSKIAGPLNGLVAKASQSGKWALVSYTNNGIMQMGLVNVTTDESISLPVATIADKCVWTANDLAIYCGIPVNASPNFSYPDDWYQGAVHFSDRIWKIDVAGRYAQLVLDFSKENDKSLDAEALAIDPINTILVFINKNDSSLWAYSL
ncbi:hypothetical protein HY412_02075 [Candidatus Kaiserbacteria bacterium]|nr:hypothetical protein [Candidatus Kaiserbacteria bacterium]